MEYKTKKRQKASLFDPWAKEVEKLLEIGVSIKSAFKIIEQKMPYDTTYNGFYRWVKRKGMA